MDEASLLDPTPTKVIGLDLDAELIRQAKNAVRYTWSRRRPTSSEWNGRIPPPPAFLQDQLDRRAPSTSTTPTTPHETRTRVQQDLKFFPACFPPMLGSLSFPVAAPSPPLQPQAYPFDSFDSQNPSRLVHHQEFPNNISFVVGDIMNRTADPAWRTQGEHFDLVLWQVTSFSSFAPKCQKQQLTLLTRGIYSLSLTKWIQIHHGDQGLLQLFDLFAQLIGPGGLLLLEPHGPASSFERTKDGPATVQFRPKTVRMTPDQFPALLAGRGFDLLRRVQPKQPNHTASAREVLLFQRQ